MRLAGITKAYIVLRDGKWDIPGYLGDGTMINMHLAYLMMRLPFGVPFTLDQAYPFVQEAIVAFGFPDIIFQPEDAFARLLARQANTNADVVLGLFPVDHAQKWDMVDLNNNGQVRKIVGKPLRTDLRYTWIIAVWTPVFSRFMHEYLKNIHKTNERVNAGNNASEQQELFISDVIQHAVDNDLHVEGVIFPDGICLDIGTPDDLVNAVRNLSCAGD
jgi:glucose-1-phosphate thymidylyltransferase